jgi:hypothetical protein
MVNTYFLHPFSPETLSAVHIAPASPILPDPYNPTYTRQKAGTKYDVRKTYPADHIVLKPYVPCKLFQPLNALSDKHP